MKKYIYIFAISLIIIFINHHDTFAQNHDSNLIKISEDSEDLSEININNFGRGINIIGDNNEHILTIDKFGGVYINGDLYIKGKEYNNSPLKGVFTPINGFIYTLSILSFVLSLINIIRKK